MSNINKISDDTYLVNNTSFYLIRNLAENLIRDKNGNLLIYTAS